MSLRRRRRQYHSSEGRTEAAGSEGVMGEMAGGGGLPEIQMVTKGAMVTAALEVSWVMEATLGRVYTQCDGRCAG